MKGFFWLFYIGLYGFIFIYLQRKLPFVYKLNNLQYIKNNMRNKHPI